ncbi:MAG: sigma-70 family RNA polymerase sigma factor [Chloroflexi bacterium]|nr:sigma-70 family RNA polymerase sigma factor [Chloroflexota bacterium]
METPTDEVLLQCVAMQDEQAFASLYDRYGRLAFSLAYRILGDRAGAEDVVQEAFLNLWRMARSFDARRGNARTWLLALVHHRAIDKVRRQRGQPFTDHSLDAVLAPGEPEDVWNKVATIIDREAIEKALAQLPQEQRQVIDMAYFGGYTHSEIAELTRVPLGTVKGRIRVGIEKLKRLLEHHR